jgi:single-stranded DNA-binding protein
MKSHSASTGFNRVVLVGEVVEPCQFERGYYGAIRSTIRLLIARPDSGGRGRVEIEFCGREAELATLLGPGDLVYVEGRLVGDAAERSSSQARRVDGFALQRVAHRDVRRLRNPIHDSAT